MVGLAGAGVQPPSLLFIYQYSYETLLKIEQCLQNFLRTRDTDIAEYSYTTGLCPQDLPFPYLVCIQIGSRDHHYGKGEYSLS